MYKYSQFSLLKESKDKIAIIANEEMGDFLWDIKDDGYPVDIKVVYDDDDYVYLSITDYRHNPVIWKDIKKNIEALIDATKDTFSISSVYYKVIQPDGRIFNRGEREIDAWYVFKTLTKDDTQLAYLTFEFEVIKGTIY